MTPTHSSSPAAPPDLCPRCALDPCACEYVVSLRPDGRNAALRDVAAEQMTKPLPHRAACPCPGCWSARMATFIPGLAQQPGRCRHGYAPEHVDHDCTDHERTTA